MNIRCLFSHRPDLHPVYGLDAGKLHLVAYGRCGVCWIELPQAPETVIKELRVKLYASLIFILVVIGIIFAAKSRTPELLPEASPINASR